MIYVSSHLGIGWRANIYIWSLIAIMKMPRKINFDYVNFDFHDNLRVRERERERERER